MSKTQPLTYEGIVVAGVGHMSKRMVANSIALKVYEDATGCRLAPGSLNIELAQEVAMPPYSQTLIRKDHEGTAVLLITPAYVNDIPGFAVRNKHTEDGHGRHSKRVVEIISTYKLRDQLRLRDGDKVTLTF